MRRVAGVLAHPTSLPGPFGIGDVGPAASRFLDWMAEAGLSVWQLLPLGPAGPGHSPYSSPSAFAGNPSLISPERLTERPWFADESLPTLDPGAPAAAEDDGCDRVQWERAATLKSHLLRRAWERFRDVAADDEHEAFEAFSLHPHQRDWLGDWSLWVALRRLAGRQWVDWPEGLRRREPEALTAAARDLLDETAYQRFLQYLFFSQWATTRQRARERNIEILGDVPFYVAHDSADVWVHQSLFELDEHGRPRRVAGVPPDYFSEDGQLWGNPLFDWDRLAATGYEWWLRRLAANLRLANRVRLDHFRAFAAYWVVAADAETAREGHWQPGPGDAFLAAARERFDGLPFVSEDLGDITPDVTALRDRFDLAGMRVLQFGLLDDNNEHHPRHHTPNAVAYSGTHDNDTAGGWYGTLAHDDRVRLTGDPPLESGDAAWSIVERTFDSAADTAIVPLQDLLGLDGTARMNRPGASTGNWSWRVRGEALTLRLATRVRRLVEASGRDSTDGKTQPL